MSPNRTPVSSDRARAQAAELHAAATIIDAEGVALLLPSAAITQAPIDGKPFVRRALDAGLTAMNLTMGVGGIGHGTDDLRALLTSIYTHLVYFDLHPDELVHVQTVEDIRRAKRESKLGIIFGVQGLASKIDGDLNLVRILQKLGLRMAQFTHNEHNALGSGCLEPNDRGLTQLGRACVAEMNHVGVVVDMAHAGERTSIEAAEYSTRPIVISHANARGLTDNPRNATDAALTALAKNGGVIGVTAYSPFNEAERGVRPRLDDMVNHMTYIADKIGVDHVGVGTDFFEAEFEVRFAVNSHRYPTMRRGYKMKDIYLDGFQRVDHMPRLTEALVARGFHDSEIKGILGENLLRVFTASWKA